MRDESSDSNVDVSVIPSQHKVTQQILSHCQVFLESRKDLDLKLMFAGSCHTEQLILCSQQCIEDTVEDSVLRTEKTGLESQEEDVPISPPNVSPPSSR